MLVIAEEGSQMGRAGAEILAVVAEEELQYLNGPVKRVAEADCQDASGKKRSHCLPFHDVSLYILRPSGNRWVHRGPLFSAYSEAVERPRA